MRAQGLLFLQRNDGFGLELRPVDLAGFQIMQGDLADRRLLVNQCVLGIVRPMVGGADDDAMGKGLAAGCSKETVDVALLQAVVGSVELALDGVDLAGASDFGNKVDAVVLGGEAIGRRPFGPRPDLAVQVAVGGFIAQVGEDQLLEVSALFTFADRRLAETTQQLIQSTHRIIPLVYQRPRH